MEDIDITAEMVLFGALVSIVARVTFDVEGTSDCFFWNIDDVDIESVEIDGDEYIDSIINTGVVFVFNQLVINWCEGHEDFVNEMIVESGNNRHADHFYLEG